MPIRKPNKDKNVGTSFRPISLAKTLEKILLPYITDNIENIEHQHGFKKQHSTSTALHKFNDRITAGFDQSKPLERTIAIALDMSKAFDTINYHKLLEKLTHTNVPPIVIKFIANYIRDRNEYM